jgi:hypothetical protein
MQYIHNTYIVRQIDHEYYGYIHPYIYSYSKTRSRRSLKNHLTRASKAGAFLMWKLKEKTDINIESIFIINII